MEKNKMNNFVKDHNNQKIRVGNDVMYIDGTGKEWKGNVIKIYPDNNTLDIDTWGSAIGTAHVNAHNCYLEL